MAVQIVDDDGDSTFFDDDGNVLFVDDDGNFTLEATETSSEAVLMPMGCM